MSASLVSMLLADGRFPAGSHAHSGGIEAAVEDGRVTGEASLEAFVIGRLWTVGLTEASFAAATVRYLAFCVNNSASMVELLTQNDREFDARLIPPPLRDASRKLGRQLIRAASRCWPHVLFAEAPHDLHQPIALGLTCFVAGVDAEGAARLAAHHAVSTPAQAAIRLLGLDPFGVTALIARMAPTCEEVVTAALAYADGPITDLPARSAPLLDIGAMEHRARDIRMFAT